MKKMIGAIVALTLVLLFVTKSLYVEGAEFFIIIASLSIIAIMINLIVKKDIKMIAAISAFVGFVFFWIFGVMDLIIDHVMYYLPTGKEDGMPLTLAMKLEEFEDSLFLGSWVSMFSVLIISLLILFTIKKINHSQSVEM